MSKQRFKLEKQFIYFLEKKPFRNLNMKLFFLFNKTLKQITSNCISHETITFDNRDVD